MQVSYADRNLTCLFNMDDQNVKPGVDSLTFAMETYFGKKVD